MSLQAIDLLWSLCSQTSLLMTTCICRWSPALASLPQLHLRSSGSRFSRSTEPSSLAHAVHRRVHAPIKSKATTDLMEGGDQAVMGAMGSGCKYKWSFTHLPAAHLLLCSPVPNRSRTSMDSGLWPRDWRHLPYTTKQLAIPVWSSGDRTKTACLDMIL